MSKLWLDSETFSTEKLRNGSYKYAEVAEVMIVTWAIDDGPVGCVDLTAGETFPPELDEAIDSDCEAWLQNGDHFDWPVFAQALPDLCTRIDPSRRRDTMLQAYSASLPGSLDMMCTILQIEADKAKSKAGKRLIQLFCMPQPANRKVLRATRHTHPVEWEEFKDYAKQDIVAMREAHRKMPMWGYKGKQLALSQLDQKINARGFAVDIELAEAAIRATDIAKRALKVRTQELTGDDVESATQTEQLLKHILARHGVDLPNMQKDTLERRAQDLSLPEELRELLRVRLQATTSSTSKFATLMRCVNADGRLRGTMQFRGAARTGRTGHRLYQPGNMPRPTMKWTEIQWAIELMKVDALHLVFPNVMKVCSNAIRGTIIAGPGKKLVVSDLANIEGRMAAWLAGEQWKLDAFIAYDNKLGPDLYCVAYGKSFNVPPESVDKTTIEGYEQRQIGKVQELMFQYGGGVGAWITGAATYRIDLAAMTESVYDTLPKWALDEAASFLWWLYGIEDNRETESLKKAEKKGTATPEWKTALSERTTTLKAKARHHLTERQFICCDAIKRLWRKAHPAISGYWKELENAIRHCVENPGVTIRVRKLQMRVDGAWLRIGLPSGRPLCYPKIRVDDDGSISYAGINPYTHKWGRVHTYGGKVFENVVQAASADVLDEPQLEIEAAGFEIVLDIHDENICEAPADRDDLNVELLSSLMCKELPWAVGLPLSAAGYEDIRYHKED